MCSWIIPYTYFVKKRKMFGNLFLMCSVIRRVWYMYYFWVGIYTTSHLIKKNFNHFELLHLNVKKNKYDLEYDMGLEFNSKGNISNYITIGLCNKGIYIFNVGIKVIYCFCWNLIILILLWGIVGFFYKKYLLVLLFCILIEFGIAGGSSMMKKEYCSRHLNLIWIGS